MRATWIAAGLLVLVALLQVGDVVDFGPVVWVVVGLAVVSAVALDVLRRRVA